MHMQVELRLGGLITVGEKAVALGQTHALLEGIAEERSVRGAADRLGLSYRAAWGRVTALEEALGRPVAVKTKGHGSVLTPFGAALREALAETLAAFAPALGPAGQHLAERLAALSETGDRPARMALSHDPDLVPLLADRSDLTLTIVGSREAVERLLRGEADLAGFHAGSEAVPAIPPFDRLLGDQAFVTVPLFTREQGLMLAHGNHLQILSLADVARTGARFVNRQPGSGTRAWFDRLLAEAGLRPADIAGYAHEEFTHRAVAALVASGAADVGMGARAAAEAFGLAFVPLGREMYFGAARREHETQLAAVVARLASAGRGLASQPSSPRSPGRAMSRAD